MNGGTITDNYTSQSGGGIDIEGGHFTFNGGNIKGNFSENLGGGLCLRESASLTGPKKSGTAIISGNTAKALGGGICTSQSPLVFLGEILISGNTALCGGGIAALNSTLYIISGTIAGNRAVYNANMTYPNALGGGVYANVEIQKTGGTIYGNNAGTNSNTAGTKTGSGHAVFFDATPLPPKYRDTTAGPLVNLNSNNNDNWGL